MISLTKKIVQSNFFVEDFPKEKMPEVREYSSDFFSVIFMNI